MLLRLHGNRTIATLLPDEGINEAN